MATSGDGVNVTLCDACKNDGKSLEANGYCDTCREYLCERCYTCHTIPTVTRRHVLLDKEQMLKVITTRANAETCPEHETKSIKYHCSAHNFFGCHVCSYHHQKTCKEVKYIPDVAKTITSTEEYKEFTEKLSNFARKSKNILADIARKKNCVDTCHKEAIASLKEFKKNILDAIDRLEKDLMRRAENFKLEQETKMDVITKQCTDVQDENQKIFTEVEVLKNKEQNCKLYIAMAKSKESMVSLEDRLNAAESDTRVKTLTFKPKKELLETLKSPFGLGKFCLKGSITAVEHIKDVNVKSGDDSSNCDIRGSTMLVDNRLIMADENNKKIKLLDTERFKLMADMKLSSSPWCVAKVTDNQVAVTVPNEKRIVFVRVGPTLSVEREVGVNGTCRGVAYYEGKLVVSFNCPPKVDVIDLQGTVLHSIETDYNGQQLFCNPFYVTINPELKVMYVSNNSFHNVVCMRFDGTVVTTYKDSEMQCPKQVVVDSSGMVYVCCYSTKNVHQLTADCMKVNVLLNFPDGPASISMNESEDKLYVGPYNNNIIKVYQVTYEKL